MDDIYPLHFLDDLKLNRIPVSWLLHFNDVLDAEKLHNALSAVLQTGDWRKLTGRLYKKKKGGLEIRVPKRFTSDRPPFQYQHDVLDTSIEEHRLAAYLGRRTDQSSIQPVSMDLREFMLTSATPRDFGGWVNKDIPLLSLRITTFTDATLVGLCWPHSVMDASGAQALLRAWSAKVSGEDIPPVLGSFDNVLSQALDNQHCEDLELARHRLHGIKKIEWALRFLASIVWNNHPEVRRIYIPRAAMVKLRSQVNDDVGKETFISDHCVLTAFVARAVARSTKYRPVSLLSSTNARFRIEQAKHGVFLQNMILPSFTFLSEWESLGRLALSQQRQMDERTTTGQTLSMLEMFNDCYESGTNPLTKVVVGDKKASLIAFNNLTKVSPLQAADFSAAVVRGGKEGRDNAAGTPTNFTVHTEPEKLSAFVAITGRDQAKNYWMIASLRTTIWKHLQEELEALD